MFTVDHGSLGGPFAQQASISHRARNRNAVVISMGRRSLKMQVRMSPFLSLCLSLMMSVGSCRCKPALSVAQVEGAVGFLRPALGDLAEEEEEQAARVRLESFLGNMKQKILRKLNLTSAPQEQGRVDPPPFMMELYNRYAADGSSAPLSDVIRSFGVLGAYWGCSGVPWL